MKGGRDTTGARIRERRLGLAVRQAHLASDVGISPSYLNLIEHDRRPIGGALLGRIARALGTDRATLAGEIDEALLDRMREAGAAQGMDAAALEAAAEVARRHPAWAALIAAQADAMDAQEKTIEALADRLAHDPALAEAMHELLSTVSVVRSTASILATTPELDANWLGRFHANLDADSRRLASGAEAVVGHLDRVAERDATRLTPVESVAAFLDAHGHAFREIEERGAAAVESLIAGLSSAAARDLAAAVLRADAADAARLPLATLAEGDGPDTLLRETGDPALVLRRLGTTDPARGLAICDAAGALIRRKAPAGFPLPVLGAGCPLWPLYEALGRPGQALHRLVEMPDGGAWSAHAVAEPLAQPGFDGRTTLRSTMLLTRAAGGDGAVPVGPGCRVCPRLDCAARREPSMLQW